ncbi:SulP family inorganic anion transporter [Zooshikella harenae]|uniref:Sulfate permease n=1 Tax=Zooshikella harenae TaxID=2827238 RepID=A0ABS5Z6H2_9GAMM|nr:sulfate permease [Zooshikella harenae]MBU2709644.1 sulfate permease [Zooshikella harenae]
MQPNSRLLSVINRLLPAGQWLKNYKAEHFNGDLIAALIVTIMLIPQSLAYALLAGLPAEMGLYASILPLVLYGIFGSSYSLSVGPVAIISLMTASAIMPLAPAESGTYVTLAILLAFISGLMLIVLGILRFGFIANFLSHPVVSGFISASGIIIIISQLKHLLGIPMSGDNLITLGTTLSQSISQIHIATFLMAISCLGCLWWLRHHFFTYLPHWGIPLHFAQLLSKTAPVLVISLATLATYLFRLDLTGVAIVGEIPKGFPQLTWPTITLEHCQQLTSSALLIAIIGFIESVSIGKTLAAKKRQRINPNQELIGLGTANLASAFSGGLPVTGGFSRSVVNYDAGASTPAAGIFAALGIAIATLWLTPLLYYLPKAALAVTIVMAVLSLIDIDLIRKAWQYSRAEFAGITTTLIITLFLGVEYGVLSGVAISISLHLFKTARPHIAVVGEIPGTEHFRNIQRHNVITYPHIISIRVDESLYFANTSFLEDKIYSLVAQNTSAQHVILMCTAINEIDLSALETLEVINQRLQELNIHFHLSEVKGPVMDTLQKTTFTKQLNGNIYLSQHQAIEDLKQVH